MPRQIRPLNVDVDSDFDLRFGGHHSNENFFLNIQVCHEIDENESSRLRPW